ncbi:VOC family protein [Kordiimonas marina]|uniref:VOC family protein n=1 Tax=Kordiimonas marina TaxID=2872312 RepID=UPI001FF12364|nr:VOC family protein [Kordiimonas marina]MCJ9429369.1 VOC family protein [Kordiimonas marina]
MEPTPTSTPAGWPRISSSLYYKDAAGMIDWLVEAFGFELRLKVEGEKGSIQHSELTYGSGVIMVATERLEPEGRFGVKMASPKTAGVNTQNMMIYVDDAESHCARARAAGATIVAEPAIHDYGADYWADKSYGALDPEGHMWWISERIRDPQ